jgi:hypothetical protein
MLDVQNSNIVYWLQDEDNRTPEIVVDLLQFFGLPPASSNLA